MTKTMPRKKQKYDKMPAAFAEGTFERMRTVLAPLETRTDLIRTAVERELERRERKDVKENRGR